MVREDKLVVEMLADANYATWSIRMQAILMVKGLWKAVTGESTSEDHDHKAMALIVLYVCDQHLTTVKACPNAKAAWEKLKDIYEAKTNARKLQLRQELTQLSMGPAEPITKYMARAREIQNQLRAVGHEVADQDLALSLMAGLPPEYNVIKTVIINADQDLSLDDMLPKLLQAEQMLPEKKDLLEAHPGETALMVKPKGGYGNNGGKFNNESDDDSDEEQQETRTCYYCGKKGHIMMDCRKKKRDDASRGYNNKLRALHYGAIAL